MYHDVLKVVQLHRLQEHELRMRSLALSGVKAEDCDKTWRALKWRQKTADQSTDFLNSGAEGSDGHEKILQLFDFKKLPKGISRMLYAATAYCIQNPYCPVIHCNDYCC